RHQLRAYLGIHQAPAKVLNNRVMAELEVKNSGQTPAYELQSWCYIRRFRQAETPVFTDQAQQLDTYSMIGAGASFTLDLPTDDPTPDEVARVVGGTTPTYVWGEIRYRDIFNNWHRTTFRLTVKRLISGRIFLAPAKEGNEAT